MQGYLAGLRALKQFEFVDSANVFLLGLSIGGVDAPLVARQEPVRGIVVVNTDGGVSTTFNSFIYANPTNTPTRTPTITNTSTRTNTPIPPTSTFTPTNTPSVTNTPTSTSTNTNTATPTATCIPHAFTHAADCRLSSGAWQASVTVTGFQVGDSVDVFLCNSSGSSCGAAWC